MVEPHSDDCAPAKALRCPARGSGYDDGKAQVLEVEAAAESAHLEFQIGKTGAGEDLSRQALTADEQDVGTGHTVMDEALADRQTRIHVASGAGCCNRVGHLVLLRDVDTPRLALLSRTPAAPIAMTRAVPPNEMKGSGIPVIGIA